MNSNSNEIVIRDSFTTRKKDSFIDIETRSLYNSDKVCLYYELYIKSFIIENRQLLNDYMNFLQCKNELNRASIISKKIEINNRKNSYIDRIYSLI